MARTTFYSRNYIGWPPIPISEAVNANSQHWRSEAMIAARRLIERMGFEAYCAWVDYMPDGFTWREFHQRCQDKLRELEQAQTAQVHGEAATADECGGSVDPD